MIRAFIVVLITTVALSTGLLYFQWNQHQQNIEAQDEERKRLAPVQIELELDHITEDMKVSQKINGLTKNIYTLLLDEKIEEIQCFYDEEKTLPCNWDQEGTVRELFVETEEQIYLSYEMTLPKVENYLLEDWFVRVKTDQTTFISLQLTEGNTLESTWVAGAELKAFIEKENIDYYLWYELQDLQSIPLFFHTEELNSTAVSNQMRLYSTKEKQDEVISSLQWFERIPNRAYLNVVYSPTVGEGFISPRLLIMSYDQNLETSEKRLATDYLLSMIPPANNQNAWLWTVLSSILVEQSDEVEKTALIINELNNNLDEQQFEQFLSTLFTADDTKLEINAWDESISSVFKQKTNFFELNQFITEPFVPLFFIETMPIYFNNQLKTDMNAIYYEQERMYPFLQTMEALEFEVISLFQEETIIVRKGANTWRFFLNQNLFVYNEENYGLLSNPIIQLGDNLYMSESWLEDIFQVSFTFDNQRGIFIRQ